MTTGLDPDRPARPPAAARARRRQRRRSPIWRWVARLGFLVVVFLAGLALGRELEENAKPSRDVTFVRTLEPVELAPPPTTVTVTITPTNR